MVKYCIEKYPMGSFPRQQSEGRYMDGYLYENIKPFADKIVDDMTFLTIIYSSTLEVGTGKSVLAQQYCEAYLDWLKKLHNIEVPFTIDNIVFRPKDLIERAFKLPKYSAIILDEWEDQHYWSELGMTLRQFFRKCRQLNLFMVVIIPNFFQMNPSYAISRSVCAIDVKFGNGFERGFFSFYNFESKKNLYVLGKKTYNYHAVRPNFSGAFTDGYVVGREEYLARKKRDLVDYEDEEAKKINPLEITKRIIYDFVKRNPDIPKIKIAERFGVSESTLYNYINSINGVNEGDASALTPTP